MKKNRKFQVIRIGVLTLALISVAVANALFPSTVRAVGDLDIDWGVPSGDPIFVVNDMKPGDCETRPDNVLNTGAVTREVGVRGVKTDEDLALGSVLEIEIENSTTTTSLYGPQTLDQFFTDSAGPNALSLGNLNSGQNFDYDFTVCFPQSAGNEFQTATVVFDLSIGIVIAPPEDCDDIDFTGDPIFGTSGNDRIRGTPNNDLIFALEGNDRVDGGSGNDCIVGGEGNDRVNDSSGNDVILGEGGNDTIDSGSGNDLVVGGEGNDNLKGGSGNDLIDGGIGNDTIDGGSGDDQITGGVGEDNIKGGSDNDQIFGGDQNDNIDGGSGIGQLFGENGNDNIKGGSGNDSLDGGPGTDNLNGNSGIDTCTTGETLIKCELP